ncbi:Dihydrofolate reductase [Dyadobacter sp. SG02]|nr:Dihydrofolate reductase [Dyadobacter sp. SG02]
MTLDGVCDHTKGIADEELHQHYTDLLRNADAILYGRITYHLMEYWRPFVANPSGEKAMDEFAVVMDAIPKIVFSRTLNDVDWKSARVARGGLEEEVRALTQQDGGDILVGSRSLIVQMLKLGLIDEFQLTIHPVIAGEGLAMFENLNDWTMLKLMKTKTFDSGNVTLYYEPVKK